MLLEFRQLVRSRRPRHALEAVHLERDRLFLGPQHSHFAAQRFILPIELLLARTALRDGQGAVPYGFSGRRESSAALSSRLRCVVACCRVRLLSLSTATRRSIAPQTRGDLEPPENGLREGAASS